MIPPMNGSSKDAPSPRRLSPVTPTPACPGRMPLSPPIRKGPGKMKTVASLILAMLFLGGIHALGNPDGHIKWKSLAPDELKERVSGLQTFEAMEQSLGRPSSSGTIGDASYSRYKIEGGLELVFIGDSPDLISNRPEKRNIRLVCLYSTNGRDLETVWKLSFDRQDKRHIRKDWFDDPRLHANMS